MPARAITRPGKRGARKGGPQPADWTNDGCGCAPAQGSETRRTFQELTAPEDLATDLVELGRLLRGELASYQMENRYIRKDGSQLWALLSVALVRGDDGKPLYFIAQILDVTERRSLERQLRHQAEHDMLTGLANRRRVRSRVGPPAGPRASLRR